MPLRDHFHPPLLHRRHWTSLHSTWAVNIAKFLNGVLPKKYFAEPLAAFGLEIDVSTWENNPEDQAAEEELAPWIPPEAALSVPMTLIGDAVEVQVFSTAEGPTLAAAIELVSRANKDRPATRAAFVNKCAAYLQQGVGLMIVDIVTDRKANLHEELLTRLVGPGTSRLAGDLYATAYRPITREEQSSLDVWQNPLAIGQPLPTLPLWIRGTSSLPIDLESTYEATCESLRMPTNGTA